MVEIFCYYHSLLAISIGLVSYFFCKCLCAPHLPYLAVIVAPHHSFCVLSKSIYVISALSVHSFPVIHTTTEYKTE